MRHRFIVLLAGLWWGSLTSLGFWIVPLLFYYLPSSSVAGSLAGQLFKSQTWVSLLCTLLMLLIIRLEPVGRPLFIRRNLSLNFWILTGLLLAFIGEFVVAPQIIGREKLQFWHNVGSSIFIVQWICSTVVFWSCSRTK